ncbi:hypothetical protein BT63DRAFT_456687 [Microthyrium microscopicum]|uniref:Uncharacterized protein n=1 Tax=Microthyrium microscopicum TaxID=703497 RepID=A0A6A6U6V9_9PEZI|nr:hypothetical protein BT63DRAFT_456687 [Microthyrium microscopicum]
MMHYLLHLTTIKCPGGTVPTPIMAQQSPIDLDQYPTDFKLLTYNDGTNALTQSKSRTPCSYCLGTYAFFEHDKLVPNGILEQNPHCELPHLAMGRPRYALTASQPIASLRSFGNTICSAIVVSDPRFVSEYHVQDPRVRVLLYQWETHLCKRALVARYGTQLWRYQNILTALEEEDQASTPPKFVVNYGKDTMLNLRLPSARWIDQA